MSRKLIGKLIRLAMLTAVPIALVGLLIASLAPAQAGTSPSATPSPQPTVSSPAPSPSPTSWTSTDSVTAGSSSDLQSQVGTVLASHGASSAESAVDSDLMPKVDSAIAANGGNVFSNVFALPFRVIINCTITYPPLAIKCTIQIQFNQG
jgi:hypothetical protein